MKQAAKIFIIIGMIAQFWAIYPVILGIIALKKMDNGEMNTTWKVIVLLLVSLLGGVFLFLDKEEA